MPGLIVVKVSYEPVSEQSLALTGSPRSNESSIKSWRYCAYLPIRKHHTKGLVLILRRRSLWRAIYDRFHKVVDARLLRVSGLPFGIVRRSRMRRRNIPGGRTCLLLLLLHESHAAEFQPSAPPLSGGVEPRLVVSQCLAQAPRHPVAPPQPAAAGNPVACEAPKRSGGSRAAIYWARW